MTFVVSVFLVVVINVELVLLQCLLFSEDCIYGMSVPNWDLPSSLEGAHIGLFDYLGFHVLLSFPMFKCL